MKKVKVWTRTIIAGPEGVFQADREATVSEELAKQLVAGGFASYIGDDGEPEPERKPGGSRRAEVAEAALAEEPAEKATIAPKRRRRRPASTGGD